MVFSFKKILINLKNFVGRILLKRYVYSVNNDVEKAKALILLGLEIRNKTPIVFFERDPFSEGAKVVFEVGDFLPLPKLTEDGHKIFIFRLQDTDPNRVSWFYGFFLFLLYFSRIFYKNVTFLIIKTCKNKICCAIFI